MDGSWTLEPSEQVCARARIEPTWTPERIASLVQLWEEVVTTAEIGRRVGVSKNAVIGQVHRIGLVPRVVKETPPPRRNVFNLPAGLHVAVSHPTDNDFHFYGGRPAAGKPIASTTPPSPTSKAEGKATGNPADLQDPSLWEAEQVRSVSGVVLKHLTRPRRWRLDHSPLRERVRD